MNPKSKTLTAWLALLLGGLGMHWFYLQAHRPHKTWRPWLYLLVLPTGLSIMAGFAEAIFFGIQPDVRWNQRWNNALTEPEQPRSGGLAVTAAALGLAAFAIAVMAGLAMLFQYVFSGSVS